MDIMSMLQNLLSDTNAKDFAPVINLLRENSFDIKRTLNALSPETLAPILKTLFMKNADSGGKESAFSENVGVTAIANVADKEIVYSLNRYLSSEQPF